MLFDSFIYTMNITTNIQKFGQKLKEGLAQAHPQAAYKLIVNGTDISSLVETRLISLSLKDNRGMESDTLELELSDFDGQLQIPPHNAEIEAWIGWKHSGVEYKGKFTVNETEHSGTPDTIRIRAMSADLKKSLKNKKERSFSNIKLGDLIYQIAYEHQLQPLVHAQLKDEEIQHIDQNESDANLLTRIADEYDAVCSVKNGYILLMPQGLAETANGLQLPTYVITRDQGDSHSYSVTGDGEETTAVKAFYYDTDSAKKLEVLVGDESNQNIKELRHIHRSKENAELAANAKYKQLKRNAARLSYTLAYGVPNLIPEMPFQFIGLKPEIDDVYWLGTNITHSINANNGYTTQIELELMLPDADDIALLYDDQWQKEKDAKFTGVTVYYQQGNTAVPLNKGTTENPKHIAKLYKTKAEAQRRLDQEYALLNPETGKFESKSSTVPDLNLYTGVIVYYKDSPQGKQHSVTQGDTSNPKKLTKIYTSKAKAEKAAATAYKKLKQTQQEKQQTHQAQLDMKQKIGK